MVVVGIVASPAHEASTAVAQSPSPEELWNAYPLDPGEEGAEPADPAPTPTVTPTPTVAQERSTGSRARSAAGDGDDGGLVAPALISVTIAAFAVGLGTGVVVRRRRHRRAAAPVPERKPAAAGAAPTPPTPEVPAADPVAFLPPAPMSAPRPPPAASAGVSEPPEALHRNDPSLPARRFGRPRPWPQEAESAWTCEINWKAGYIKSGFRAMVAPPGEARRTSFGQSRPIKWTLMDDPEPPTEQLVEGLRELVTALTEVGWVRIGLAGPWYSQRFLWAGYGQPRPLAPLKGKEANA